ncbi:uncharacterized protein EV422DRAFT_537614 [Fimicolochytrium jonesii]|uniref:uncharacterized protein n=1 Tax=Fimicolochytrium jonesii TaxID=1396493 RepID=UPI0022FEC186|nr:uncharacterized protein EV422DRAFT_537614 [Fimicolochytrium jonesii]KAI8818593.1 hypothetical protein EV422DRAFT_537614 [Fimicolochytrium jonesii]
MLRSTVPVASALRFSAPALLRFGARSSAVVLQTPAGSAARQYASDHHDDHHDDAGHSSKPPLHKEEWLEVARNWPHEYHYPGHYRAGTLDEIYPPSDNYGHKAETPSGAETLGQHETFFNSFWVKAVLAVVGTTVAYRINDSYATAAAERGEPHPLTQWLTKYSNLFTAERAHEDHTKWIAVRQREADDRLIVQHAYDPKPYRISFPGMFERASDHLIDVGSQINVSDVKIKYSWQKDDDLLGPPFPKNKS